VLTRIARAQSQTVDFATSNVRGAGIPLYICGALVVGNYPIGPLGGVAFNLTMLSYNHNLDMGLNIDTAAIAEPARLQECIQKSLHELMDYAPLNKVGIPAPPNPRVTRWLKKLRLQLATTARRATSRLPRR
jgi:hypothetical protein